MNEEELMKGQRGGQGQGYQDRLRHPEFRNSGKLAPSQGGNDDLEPGEKPPKDTLALYFGLRHPYKSHHSFLEATSYAKIYSFTN